MLLKDILFLVVTFLFSGLGVFMFWRLSLLGPRRMKAEMEIVKLIREVELETQLEKKKLEKTLEYIQAK